MYLRSSFAAKCTEHNGDSPMCQADASCQRMRVVAKRRVRRPNEPYILMANRKPNEAAGPIREFRGETR